MKSMKKDWYKKGWTLDIQNMSWVEDTNRQVDFLIKQLQLKGTEKILDLACGFGRHSLEFARRGYDVTGIDITPVYIDYANEQAKKKNLNAKFICQDIRTITFDTKTNAGTRQLPIKDDVAECIRRIIEDRPKVEFEKMLDGYTGFLCIDENGEPLVAMHWEHRFNHMVGRYNSIFKVQMPNITPHVCRHTYCTNQAKAGMSPKTLQYLMGHSDIGVTLNTYTHLGIEDAAEEIKRMENLEKARKEMYGEEKEKPMKQNMFKVV